MKRIWEFFTNQQLAYLEGPFVHKYDHYDSRGITVNEHLEYVDSLNGPVAKVEDNLIYSFELHRHIARIEDNKIIELDKIFNNVYEVDDGCTNLEKAALFIVAHNY